MTFALYSKSAEEKQTRAPVNFVCHEKRKAKGFDMT